MNDMDILLKRAFEKRVEQLQPSDALLARIKRETHRRKKEKTEMNFRMKKMIAFAAVLCLLCASCFAAVQMANVQSSSGKEIENYSDLAAAAKEIGIEAKYVREFKNGFAFDVAGIATTFANDAQGNAIGEEYHGLNIGYADAHGRNLMLRIEKGNPYVDNGEQAASGYSSATYKFVPPDYEKTEEDKAMEAAGDFFISYGNEEVELNVAENYKWQDGEIYYSLLAFDCAFGEAAMAGMAQEIMG